MWVKVGDKRVNFNLVGRGGGGGIGVMRFVKCESL